MATRFGGANYARSDAVKMRWIVVGLVVFIVILLGVLVFVASSAQKSQVVTPVQDQQVAAETNVAPGIEVLISASRIEAGTQFDGTMFIHERRSAEQLPDGVITSNRLQEVVGKYATVLINTNTPIVESYITKVPQANAIDIPPGYRAVSIFVDARKAVEGWAKPKSRVDVLWTFTDTDNRKKVATIVRACQVASVSGGTDSGARVNLSDKTTTVTLLVTEQDARKIELARNSGELSLTLVGDKEILDTSSGMADITDMGTIIDRPREASSPKEEPADGVMYTRDPKTGIIIQYKLIRGRWQRVVE